MANSGSPSFISSPPPLDHDQYLFNASKFTSLYHSLSPQKSQFRRSSLSPSASSSADDFQLLLDPIPDEITTERQHNQARLILEYHQICQHYDLCLDQLQILCGELETLRRENADLRLNNSELVKLVIGLSSKKAMKRSLRNEKISNLDKQSAARSFIKRESISLPKSMSLRSNGYLKTNQQAPPPSQMRVTAPPFFSRSKTTPRWEKEPPEPGRKRSLGSQFRGGRRGARGFTCQGGHHVADTWQ